MYDSLPDAASLLLAAARPTVAAWNQGCLQAPGLQRWAAQMQHPAQGMSLQHRQASCAVRQQQALKGLQLAQPESLGTWWWWA